MNISQPLITYDFNKIIEIFKAHKSAEYICTILEALRLWITGSKSLLQKQEIVVQYCT